MQMGVDRLGLSQHIQVLHIVDVLAEVCRLE
jgi:hypothetical protein